MTKSTRKLVEYDFLSSINSIFSFESKLLLDAYGYVKCPVLVPRVNCV